MKTFKNVTLYIESSFIGINTIFCKELTVEHRSYAQYDRATSLKWKQPRQRKFRGTVLAYDQTMKTLDRETALLPSGKNNSTYCWMLKELSFELPHREEREEEYTATELAENAVDANGHDEWLDDDTHWVWDAACIALEKFNL